MERRRRKMTKIRDRKIYGSPSETVPARQKITKYLIKWRGYDSEFSK
jgi:hypothetical protein